MQRFSQQAVRAVLRANDAARQQGTHTVFSEHLLLGMLGDGDTVAAIILQQLGISVADVHQRVANRSIPEQQHGAKLTQDPEMASESKQALSLAADAAHLAGSAYVGTEHVLIGLMQSSQGFAHELLASLGATEQRIREQLHKIGSGDLE